jgi:hypothetical protein
MKMCVQMAYIVARFVIVMRYVFIVCVRMLKKGMVRCGMFVRMHGKYQRVPRLKQ